jgi:Holliday junction DNA helicase RuvA
MYDSLRGVITGRSPTGIVIDVGGVGFALEVSLRTAETIPRHKKEVTLLVHHRIQDERFRLFGFADEDERTLFREVIKVASIGPATALALLSGLAPSEIWSRIEANDWKPLARTRGIGPKTAQRICTELKEKARRFISQAAPGKSGAAGASDSRRDDVVSALLVLGCTSAQAESAAEAALAECAPDAPIEDVVRSAIRSASG